MTKLFYYSDKHKIFLKKEPEIYTIGISDEDNIELLAEHYRKYGTIFTHYHGKKSHLVLLTNTNTPCKTLRGDISYQTVPFITPQLKYEQSTLKLTNTIIIGFHQRPTKKTLDKLLNDHSITPEQDAEIILAFTIPKADDTKTITVTNTVYEQRKQYRIDFCHPYFFSERKHYPSR